MKRRLPHVFHLVLLVGLVAIAPPTIAALPPANVVTVANIAALRSLSPSGQYASVNVAGYHALNDGGGGIFNWDRSSVAADNGGTVINPLGNPGSGRFVRQDAQALPYSVRWFGAKGDGVTDDYAALTATITAVRNSSQRTVALVPGTYILETIPLDMSGVNIEGSGAIASKLKRGNSARGVYTIKLDGSTSGGAARMTYRNFQIDGNSSANANGNWPFVLIGNVVNNVFENLQILNAKTGGLRAISSDSSRPNINTFINLQVRDSDGKGMEIAAARNMHFIGLAVENIGDVAVDLSGSDEPLARIIIQNFWIEKTGNGDAVQIRGNSDGVVLESGNIQDYGNSSGTQGSGINVAAARRVRLRGLDISPRAGTSSPGHRKITIGRASGAVVIEDHSFSAGDVEDNSPTSTR